MHLVVNPYNMHALTKQYDYCNTSKRKLFILSYSFNLFLLDCKSSLSKTIIQK